MTVGTREARTQPATEWPRAEDRQIYIPAVQKLDFLAHLRGRATLPRRAEPVAKRLQDVIPDAMLLHRRAAALS